MDSQTDFSEGAARKDYKAPYSHNHPVPTVQRYREHRGELDEQQKQAEVAQHTEEDDSKTRRAFESVKSIFKGDDDEKKHPSGTPYPTANRNTNEINNEPNEHDSGIPRSPSTSRDEDAPSKQDGEDVGSAKQNGRPDNAKKGQQAKSATEKAAGHTDAKTKRKEMKHNKRDDGGRVVTDPVTHLPLVIRDSTEKDMKRAPENEPASGSVPKTATGSSGATKSSSQLELENSEFQDDYDGMQRVFPPPSYDDTKAELVRTFQIALTVGLIGIVGLVIIGTLLVAVIESTFYNSSTTKKTRWKGSHTEKPGGFFVPPAITIVTAVTIGVPLILLIQGWLGNKVSAIWEDEIWDSARAEEKELNNTQGRLPESVTWMNGLLASVWPLINPDLFASITDMLEDVMQASLPKIIRMVSVDDLGQGSESIRILGIRWLPTGAASQTVDEEGNLMGANHQGANDRTTPGQGKEEDTKDDSVRETDSDVSNKKKQQQQQKEVEQQTIREGMEAEQGDFVNMELAFSYRARSSGKSLKSKAKNAHLFLKFYLPGGIFVPVWVEVRGMIGTMRLRLQLTPDPPFFSLCTLTFVGQPRADLSCTPLSRHLPNLMNVPLISSFVQSSIDAALAEYVAPKSLTLDLKDMLVGDDFKKDTNTRGLVMIYIKHAKDFKEGDGGFGPIKGSSDAYVTCSWGKFGKTITSTRVIEGDQKPIWHEWAVLLVTPEEINADEKLRLQIWDSDKHTADDDLGRVEVDLKMLMHSPETKNQQFEREDRLMGPDSEEEMPGTLSWTVGYYAKIGVTDQQLASQTEDGHIKSKEDLKKHVSETAKNKLREATAHNESKEMKKQKVQDYKEHEDALICASAPDSNYPSGIFSIQIHNITGLEVEAQQKREKGNNSSDREDEAEQSDDLPSSYCTIIINHKKVFVTRTKPKNAKPFFNAGTERFIRDWRNTEVMISVRDSREAEDDALLGIIYLPLHKVFEKRSQVADIYRLVGGIGFGRARISIVFRSVDLQLPKELLGWDYGTLEIKAPVKLKGSTRSDFASHRIKLRSNMSRAKMPSDNGTWHPKKGEASVFLPCRKRYAMPLICEFRKSSLGPDSTPAFAIFWLKEIPDEEESTITLQVWQGGKENLKRATACAGYKGMDDGEQPLGEIEITMKFWRGLSGYHKKYARKSKNADMRDVMEVLDTANDEKERDDGETYNSDSQADSDESTDSDTENEDQHPNLTPSDSTTSQSDQCRPTPNNHKPSKLTGHTNDSSSDSDEDISTKNPIKKARNAAKGVLDGQNNSNNGSRGIIAQIKDYKDHHKQLHRTHRGIMQWKGARTANWAVNKVRAGKGKVERAFEHSEKDQGVETEV